MIEANIDTIKIMLYFGTLLLYLVVGLRAEDSDGWWSIEEYGRNDGVHVKVRKFDGDDIMIHTCYEYQVLRAGRIVAKSGSFCYPSIIVTGVRKCSTSALYGLITSFPGSLKMIAKENCPFLAHHTLLSYFESLPEYVPTGYIIADGCVDLSGNLKMRKLLRDPNTFYVVVIRDFSDWVWSAYNYWCSTSYDDNCDEGNNWAMTDIHNRSVSTFHDIAERSHLGYTNISSPLKFNDTCGKARHFFQSYEDRLLQGGVSQDAYIVLASEELESNPKALWSKLASKAGMPQYHPGLDEFKKYRYNVQSIDANSRRGDHPEMSKIAVEKHTSGLYPISNNEPLMHKTRAILSICWKDDCLWARNASGYSYNACADSGRISPTTEVSSKSKGLTVASTSTSTSTPYSGYLLRHIQSCSRYMDSIGAGVFNVTTASMKRVLVVTPNGATAVLMFRLINSSLKRNLAVMINNSSMLNKNSSLGPLGDKQNCQSYFQSRFLVVELGDIESVKQASISSSPSGYTLHLKPGGGMPPSLCTDFNFHFDKVVLVHEDSLMSYWNQFLLKQDIQPAGFKGGRLNWTEWDAIAMTALSADTSFNLTNVDVSPQDALLLQSEFLFSGPSKEGRLQALLSFVANMTTPTEYLRCAFAVWLADLRRTNELISLFSQYKKMKEKLEWIYSSDVIVCMRKQLMLKSLQGLEAYFYGGFYPHVKCSPAERQQQQQKQQQIQHQQVEVGHQPRLHHHAAAGLVGVHNYTLSHIHSHLSVRSCQVRYSYRDYLAFKDKRIPVALVGNMADDTTNTRLLVEYATSYLTGSITTNHALLKTLPAELFCGQRMPLVYTKPSEINVKIRPPRSPFVAMNPRGRYKCSTGLVRDFTRFIILVRDPIIQIWNLLTSTSNSPMKLSASQLHSRRQFNAALHLNKRSSSVISNSSSIGDTGSSHTQQEIMQNIKNLSRSFNLPHFLGSDVAADVVAHIPADQYLIMSYEYLAHTDTRTQALHRLLHFLQLPATPTTITEDSKKCAYVLTQSDAYTHTLNTAVQALKQHHHILCGIKKTLESVIDPAYLRLVLLSHVDCSGGGTGGSSGGGSSGSSGSGDGSESGNTDGGTRHPKSNFRKQRPSSTTSQPFAEWLNDRLLEKKVSSQKASEIVRLFQAADIDSLDVFAHIPPTSFTEKFLSDVGLSQSKFGASAAGLQAKLLLVHKETIIGLASAQNASTVV